MSRRLLPALLAAVLFGGPLQAAEHRVTRVRSPDGAVIAVECAGAGPELLIVHGGTGDRTRWTPMFPYLERDFTVCAMDRRAHGESTDGGAYSLRKEAEDIAAVVRSRGRAVTVLGHSYGGVAAYEAAFLTPRIAGLILYEPPVRAGDHGAAQAEMEALIKAGDREGATTAFLRRIVQVSPGELEAMKARPSWKGLVASIDTALRQDRQLTAYRWDAARAKRLRIPVLLLRGSRTVSPELVASIEGLAGSLPRPTLVVLEGQEHNAMDSDREHLAAAVRTFLRP